LLELYPDKTNAAAGSMFVTAASKMEKTDSAPVQQDAGALHDSTNASNNVFETDRSQFLTADESIKRSATW
jgi:hypothetical protein